MASPVPSPGALRALRQSLSSFKPSPAFTSTASQHQIRHATLLRRPKRPYTFTQLVTLSDGSTFLHRTTNPMPVYKGTKDIRNTPLWNPSSQKLLNVEEDEAGRLRAFRAKFGRGWDAEGGPSEADAEGKTEEPTDHLLDLISGRQKKDTKEAQKAVSEAGKAKTPVPPKGKPAKAAKK